MSNFPTVEIPAYEFQFNLIVCPLPYTVKNVSDSYMIIIFFIQGVSRYFVLKDNYVKPTPTGGSHWLELLPGHMYCFLPSMAMDQGKVYVYDHTPHWIKDFLYSLEIYQVIDHPHYA